MPCRVQAVDPGIVEHVRAIAPLPTQPEIVDVGTNSTLEHRNKLMLGPIEAALAGIALVPNQKVFPLRIQWPGGIEQFR